MEGSRIGDILEGRRIGDILAGRMNMGYIGRKEEYEIYWKEGGI